jgi:anti-sigma regulatory factor (Ser/Thr protein kinase)
MDTIQANVNGELISLSITSSYDYIHFVCDTSESLIKAKVTFPSETIKDKFIQDIRILIYELFSNAVNHSNSKLVSIVYRIDDDSLIIEIETSGTGFTIKPVDSNDDTKHVPPYKNEIINKKFNVYKDSENLITCRVLNEMDLEFELNKLNPGKGEEEIPEHYGLYLITCLSDQVKYKRTYDGKDIFTIKKSVNPENKMIGESN